MKETQKNGKSLKNILESKHAEAKPQSPDCVLQDSDPLSFHPSMFDEIDENLIAKAGQKTTGAHGPSGLDAAQWRLILSSFEKHSTNLRRTIATIARRIATETLPTISLMEYNNCSLVALDKCPGVRPIGIGEVLRRIMGRTI